jgi:N-acetylmuramoyl-L-alanine amidase
MRVAVVIGHNEKSQGAVNVNYGMSEFRFNQALAHDIEHEFGDLFNYDKDEIIVVYRETNLQDLPNQINDLEPDLIVSLHCNAFNKTANGCEMLYYHKSIKGKEIARIFQNTLVQKLDNKDRGIKPKTTEDRGGYLLRYTNAPCIIAEPFFIDNDDEFLRADECFKNGDLTKWYCEAINKSLEYLKGLR